MGGAIFTGRQTDEVRALLPTGATSDSVRAKIYISLSLKNLIGSVLVGGLIVIGTYKRMNEALHRALRYWAERATSQHEERLRIVGGVSGVRKMATFVSAAYASGASQTDQQYLPHMISGAVASSLVGPRSVGGRRPANYTTHRNRACDISPIFAPSYACGEEVDEAGALD